MRSKDKHTRACISFSTTFRTGSRAPDLPREGVVLHSAFCFSSHSIHSGLACLLLFRRAHKRQVLDSTYNTFGTCGGESTNSTFRGGQQRLAPLVRTLCAGQSSREGGFTVELHDTSSPSLGERHARREDRKVDIVPKSACPKHFTRGTFHLLPEVAKSWDNSQLSQPLQATGDVVLFKQ